MTKTDLEAAVRNIISQKNIKFTFSGYDSVESMNIEFEIPPFDTNFPYIEVSEVDNLRGVNITSIYTGCFSGNVSIYCSVKQGMYKL